MSSVQPLASTSLSKLLDDAWNLINDRNVAKAVATCQHINRQFPTSAEGWFATSFLTFQLRQTDQALTAIEQAIKLQPQQPRWQLHKAHTLLLQGDRDAAWLLAEQLAGQRYQEVELCAELALVLNKLNQYPLAIEYYQHALALAPKDAQLYFNLAAIQRYTGDLDAAEANLDQAIALNPYDYEAYLQRSSLRQQTSENNHVEQLLALLEKEIHQPIGKAQVCYALAKEYEDLKQYAASFEYLTLGAKSRRANMRYELQHDLETLIKIASVFDQQFFEQSPLGCSNDEAIFVLGLPRTGSTLIERIISSHDDVYSAGELNDFALQMMAHAQKLTKTPPKTRTELVELTSQLDFASLGEDYIKSTRPHTGQQSKFIDKLPLNSLYVGLIHCALPKAKLIYVKRNPLDTIYAIYKQLFTNGYPFSYDLNELTEYYIAHYQLMEHWKTVLPNVIYEVNYEDVVTDVAGQAKALLEYCQLDWQAQCLEFHHNKAAATTASASQVRQGIYTSSAGKWRHYQQELSAVKQRLEQAGIL
ncbi:sulfotransferase [Colwelliaceae bacterium 6471]